MNSHLPPSRRLSQERFESSAWGRRLLNAFFVLTIAVVVVWNLPSLELRRLALPVARAPLNATGLNQAWNMFAPEPRKQSIAVFARIDYADGTSATWEPPTGGPFVGQFRTYRWRKWMELVRLDKNKSLWEPAASWVAQEYDHQGRTPLRVTLVRRWQSLAAPGSGQPDAQWKEFSYFTLEVAGAEDA